MTTPQIHQALWAAIGFICGLGALVGFGHLVFLLGQSAKNRWKRWQHWQRTSIVHD